VVVFLPLALSNGIISSLLREFALVVVFSTLMSLFVSFTITPLLASRFGRVEHLNSKSLWGKLNLGFERIIDLLKEQYGMLLSSALKRKRWLLSGVILLIIGSFMLVAKGFVGAAFIPAGDKGELLVHLELAPAASIYQTNLSTQQAEKLVMARPEVSNVFSSIGFVTGSISGTSNNSNLAEMTVTLVDAEDRRVRYNDSGTTGRRTSRC
jgi:HAE1 family hydrophobic/amphiphilic exporter-1